MVPVREPLPPQEGRRARAAPAQTAPPECPTAANSATVTGEGEIIRDVRPTFTIIFTKRLPFDEEQLEIPDNDKTDPFEKQPQGFINNNPAKNNPLVNGKGGGGGKKSGGAQQSRGGRRQPQTRGNRNSGGARKHGGSKGGARRQGGGGGCPGGDVGACLAACEEVQRVEAYTVCVKTCGKRC